MRIEMQFAGPHSDDMVKHGCIDLEKNGFDHIFIGKGETRMVAAARALGQIADSSQAQLLAPVNSYVQSVLLPESMNIEADGFLCNVFCIIRVSE